MQSIPELKTKLPGVGTTIFTVMSQLALDHDAVNLSQGFPDFDGPAELLDGVSHYLHHGRNQYAPMAGVPSLREALAKKVQSLYGPDVDPDTEITITSGATEALFCALSVVVRPGDEVIVFDPAYDSYDPAVTLNGGRTIHLPLTAPDFRIDWNRVGDRISGLCLANVPNIVDEHSSLYFPPGTSVERRNVYRGACDWFCGFDVIPFFCRHRIAKAFLSIQKLKVKVFLCTMIESCTLFAAYSKKSKSNFSLKLLRRRKVSCHCKRSPFVCPSHRRSERSERVSPRTPSTPRARPTQLQPGRPSMPAGRGWWTLTAS